MKPCDFYELKRLIHHAWMLQRRAQWAEQKAAGCDGKHRFRSFGQAHGAIHRNTEAGVGPYRCRGCGFWHLGMDNRPRRAA